MVMMTDENDGVALLRVFHHLDVHLRYEGARSVDHTKSPALGIPSNGRRNAVSAEDRDGSVRYLCKRIHKYGASGGQLVDNKPVMNDFLSHVNGSAQPV
jgi:hypothetical protein